jgi:peroxiredoxin
MAQRKSNGLSPSGNSCRTLDLILSVALLVLGAGALDASAATVPRKSPEFSVARPDGTTLPLSSFKGQVVVMEFLFIRSEHCLRVASTLNKLHSEPGLKGFQPLAVVFDPPGVASTGGQLIAATADYLKLDFPVGYASKASVDAFLGRAQDEILNIPQVVVIDRAGTIRAASGGKGGNPALEDAASLRKLIADLLREN